MPQPRPYPIQLAIKKNETLTWTLDQDWLKQFVTQLDHYLNSKGWRKSKNHLALAKKLKDTTDTIGKADAKDRDQLIEGTLLPLIVDKSGLVKKGWNKDKSYLYHLCELSETQYYMSVEVAKAAKVQIQAVEARHIAELDKRQKEADTAKAAIEKLQEEKARLESRVQKQVEEHAQSLEQAKGAVAHKLTNLQREQEALNDKVSTLTIQLAEKTQLIAKLQTDLAAANDEVGKARQITTQPTVSPAPVKPAEVTRQPKKKGKPLQTEEVVVLRNENQTLKNVNMSLSQKLMTGTDQVATKEKEIKNLRGIITAMTTFIDNVFSDCLGYKISSLFIDNSDNRPIPTFTDAQKQQFKRIAVDQPSGLDKTLSRTVINPDPAKFKSFLNTLSSSMSTPSADDVKDKAAEIKDKVVDAMPGTLRSIFGKIT